MAVAASFYGEIDSEGSFQDPPGIIDLEPYSSLGGNLDFWFTDDGLFRLPVPATRFKPEVTGPDGSNTSFFGQDISYDTDSWPNFFGTSASAPHVAGVAALLLEQNTTFSPANVYDILRSSARDIAAPGRDARSGDGLVDALRALQAIHSPKQPQLWILDGYGQVQRLR